MLSITIETGDICYRMRRRQDGSGQWNWHIRHADGSFSVALDVELDGRDVLWQVAGMCEPPAVAVDETSTEIQQAAAHLANATQPTRRPVDIYRDALEAIALYDGADWDEEAGVCGAAVDALREAQAADVSA